MASDAAAALGFAPHSGWSVLVAVGVGPGDARLSVLLRRRIELAETLIVFRGSRLF